MTAWMLRFISNCKARRSRLIRRSGPLVTEEITTARIYWVRRVQRADQAGLQSPGWKLVEDEDTGVLKCEGRDKDIDQRTFQEDPWLRSSLLMYTIK